MGLQEVLHQALDPQNSGNLSEAERLYLAVLAAHPRNFDANHLIGIMRFQQGRGDEALRFRMPRSRKSRMRPQDAPEVLSHHGLVLHAQGRNVEALGRLRKALA